MHIPEILAAARAIIYEVTANNLLAKNRYHHLHQLAQTWLITASSLAIYVSLSIYNTYI